MAFYIFYQAAMALSLLASVCVLVLVWRRRRFHGARTLIALVGATFVWIFGFFSEANSPTLGQQLFFNNIGYLGLEVVPVAWFIFAWQYTRGKKKLTGAGFAPLFIIPVVITILIWTNDWHHLMWSNEHLSSTGIFLATAKTYGSFFWIAFVYNYALTIAGTLLLMRRLLVGAPLYTGQAVSLIIAASLPLLWNAIYVFNLLPLPRKDLTPAAFTISEIAIAFGLLRYHLLAVVPFARQFIVEQLTDGILVFNPQDRLLEINPAARKITGSQPGIIGKELKDLVPLSPVFARLSAEANTPIELSLDVGRGKRFYEMAKSPMLDDHGLLVGWLATLHDITERRNLQRQVMARDRLASIGQLTSGIAHEINNPLTPVLGFSEILLGRDLPDDVKSKLQIIHDSARQASGVIGRLLAFSRQDEPERMPCNIEELVESAIRLRSYHLKTANIEITREYTSGLQAVIADPVQIQQVFLNLLMNAEYAMGQTHGRGNLVIRLETTDGFVRVSFRDDGPGIPEENLDKLFTPFFTTKKVGEGTGLGLSVCYGIIHEHKGRIYARSVVNEGATFVVELPV